MAAALKGVPTPQLIVWPSPDDHVSERTFAVAVTVTPPYVAVRDRGPQVLSEVPSTHSQTGIPTQVRRYAAVPIGSSEWTLLSGAMPIVIGCSVKVRTSIPAAWAGVYLLIPGGGASCQAETRKASE